MVRRRFVIVFLLTAACFPAGPVDAVAQSPIEGGAGGSPGDSAVLLRNGNLMFGRVRREGDRLLIWRGEGNEIRLPAGEVEFVGRDLPELYNFQRRRLPPGDAARRVELARWCLRMQLAPQAGEMTLEAMRLDPLDPAVIDLERRLRRHAAGPAPAVEPIGKRPLTREQVAEAVSALPSGAVEQFAHRVQPLLLNRCGASGCHGSAGRSSFQVLRSPWGGAMPAPLTQRNLTSAVQQVDRAHPEQSPLLTAAAQLHAGLETPLLSGDSEEFELLKKWVTRLASPDSPPPVPPKVTSQIPSTLLMRQEPEAANRSAPPTASHGRTSPQAVDAHSPTASVETDAAAVDPFDPQVFNRRFFPGGKPEGRRDARSKRR